MAGKKNTDKEGSSWIGKVEDYSRKIWLAGLGVYSKIDTDGSKLFDALVKDGEKAEKLTKSAVDKKVDAAKDSASSAKSRISGVKDRAMGKWDELEGAFDKRLNSAISRLGVPSRNEVKALHSKVDTLTKQIEKLTGAKVAPVAAENRSGQASAKTAAKPLAKAAAKPAAKTAAPPNLQQPSQRPNRLPQAAQSCCQACSENRSSQTGNQASGKTCRGEEAGSEKTGRAESRCTKTGRGCRETGNPGQRIELRCCTDPCCNPDCRASSIDANQSVLIFPGLKKTPGLQRSGVFVCAI